MSTLKHRTRFKDVSFCSQAFSKMSKNKKGGFGQDFKELMAAGALFSILALFWIQENRAVLDRALFLLTSL